MTTKKSKKHGRLYAFLVVTTIKLVSVLPLSVARKLGAVLATLGWLFNDRNAQVTKKNIALCYPHMSVDEQLKFARESVRHTGMLAAEVCVVGTKPEAWVNKKLVAVKGEEQVFAEMAKGKGLIVLAPHIGNWEFLGQMLVRYGKLTALYQPPKQAYLDPIIKKNRERNGMNAVPTTPKGLVKLLKSLKEGGITAILPDQNPMQGSGMFVPFFNRPAYTMTLIHSMLRRSEASVLFFVAKRVDKGFEVHVLKPPEGIHSEDMETCLRALNQGVEACVAICPEQNQWEYKRFNKCPEGVDNPYR